MDWVQTYAACMLSLVILIRWVAAAVDGDGLSSKMTNNQNLYWLPVSLLFALPLYGRVFGWF